MRAPCMCVLCVLCVCMRMCTCMCTCMCMRMCTCTCMCMCGRRAVCDRDREGQQPALVELGEHDEQAEAEQQRVEGEVLWAGSGGEGSPVGREWR